MKNLFRSKENRMIAGVCGGLAEHFNIDANLIRIGCVVFGCTGLGLLAYIVAVIILPEN